MFWRESPNSRPPLGSPSVTSLNGSTEVIGGQAEVQDLAVVRQLRAIRTCRARDHHQWQQVFLARMRQACRGYVRPIAQTLVTFALRERQRLTQPSVERFRSLARLRPKSAQ